WATYPYAASGCQGEVHACALGSAPVYCRATWTVRECRRGCRGSATRPTSPPSTASPPPSEWSSCGRSRCKHGRSCKGRRVNRDFSDMLCALCAARVEFLIVGAYALAAHGLPRATGDLGIWVRPDPENAERVLTALRAFGAPLFDLRVDDLLRDDTVFQLGVPPARIDLMTGITGVTFDAAWRGRMETT